MILIGVDLATTTGVCFGRPDVMPTAIAWRAPVTGDDLGAFGSFFWQRFNNLFDRLAVQLVADERMLLNYESPVLIEKRWDEEKRRMVGGNPIVTTRKLQGLGMLLESAAAVHPAPIDVRECHLSTIKKELAGSGRADKAEMAVSARRAGIALPDGKEAFDAADAFGAWVLAIRYHAPEHLDYWLRKIHGQGLGQERMSAAEARKLL